MSENWMNDEIEKRELAFNYKQKVHNRIEELLGYDENLVQIYYQVTLARQLENELYYYLIPLMSPSFHLKGGKFIAEADCRVYFHTEGKRKEQNILNNKNVKEAAIKLAEYLEQLAKSLTFLAESTRKKVTEIPQVSHNRNNLKKVQEAVEQAEKELLTTYVEQLQVINKRIVEKQREKS